MDGPRIATLTMNPALDVSTTVGQVMPERKLRCGMPRHEPGGGGVNVSRAIRKLGGDSLAIYTSGGPSGQLLQGLLDEEKVSQLPIAIRGWTRQNLNVLEKRTGQQFRFVMPGPSLDEKEWRLCLASVRALHPPAAFVVASGSLPPGVPVDFYARLAALAKEIGARFVLDCSGEPLRLAAGQGVFLLKTSLREFEELTGDGPCDPARLAARAMGLVEKRRCDVLVLSLGAKGALWVSADGQEELPSPSVSVQSSVGAGDAMVAGIVLSLARGWLLPEAVRFGVAAAAAAVMNPGTQLCHREDAERLYAETQPAHA